MYKLSALFILLLLGSIHAQIPMKWQTPTPTGYDYDEIQMLDSAHIVGIGLMGGFVRSDDGGNNWKFVWTNTYKQLTGLDFVNLNIGYACGNGNSYFYEKGTLLKTVDGGNSWDTLNVPFNSGFSDVDFINADTGWVAGDNGHVFRTYNSGSTWNDVSFNGPGRVLSIVMVDKDTGYVCGENGFLYRTFNGGNSWNLSAPLITDRINSMYFLNGRIGWCTSESQQIFRTDNSGDSWTQQLNAGGTSSVKSICFVDSIHGHAISTEYYYRTSDGGQTWQSESHTYFYITAISFSDMQHGIRSGPHGILQKTNDGGLNWTNIAAENNFYHYMNIQFVNDSTGFCVGQHGKILKTIDGGQTWTNLSTSTSSDFGDLFFLNANLGYIVGENGMILKTSNGGASFTTTSTGNFNSLFSVYFLNPDTGWVCGINSTIFKTMNGGITWDVQTLPSFTDYLYDIVFTDANTGFIAGGINRIFNTNDGGNTWAILPNTPFVSHSVYKFQFLNHDTGWAITDEGDLLKTIDAGQTWSTQYSFCLNISTAFHFYDSSNGVVGGIGPNAGCKLFRTRDGGNTWENTGLPLGNDIQGLWMSDTNRVFVCAQWGTIVLCGDTTDFNIGIQEYGGIDNKLVVFPNPVSGFLRIKIEEHLRHDAVLIYNCTGQAVKSYSGEKTEIDVTGLAQGIYLLKVGEICVRFFKE